MLSLEINPTLDYHSSSYQEAYGRVNALVIEGEQEASHNYRQMAQMMPEHQDRLLALAKMERRHQRSFLSCGRHLGIKPDLAFAQQSFEGLRHNFDVASAQGALVDCLLIQSLVIECFAIATCHAYIPVADDFARKLTESVLRDEYKHLNFGKTWLQSHFKTIKSDLESANRQNLPLMWQILDRLKPDAAVIGIDPEALEEDFTIQYGEALEEIGFGFREVACMSDPHGWAA